MSVDMHLTMNLLSEVIVNRPPPLREFDQIYMRAGDMLYHVDHISSFYHDREVVFVGDGDAIALALCHLGRHKQVAYLPASVHVLDFDERMIESINRFAKENQLDDIISASYYNVRDPLPSSQFSRYDAFHTNPPYGKNNDGQSVEAFVRRGIEACRPGHRGCVVLADDDEISWTQDVLHRVQGRIFEHGCMITELRPKAHQYHLDDAPDLRSCTLLLKQSGQPQKLSLSMQLTPEECSNFYGKGDPLKIKKITDRTAGGRFPSRDHTLETY